jgi:hypothetical protein
LNFARSWYPDFMQGIPTVIVAFIFVCILFPKLVKHEVQFYTAFGLILLILLLEVVAEIFGSPGFNRFIGVMNGLLTIGSLILIVLATGGLSLKDLTGEFKNAFEVIRRGESDKEVIVPLTGEMPKPRQRPAGTVDEPTVHTIETPPTPAERKPDGPTSIPLE